VPDEVSVAELVHAAAAGDSHAWSSIVDRFAPLVWNICMRYHLSRHDATDISQNVWLRLTEHLDSLREPAALPGWLATTTRRECFALFNRRRLEVPSAMDIDMVDDEESTDPGRHLIQSERHEALLTALAELPDSARALLLLLMEDPPRSYREISELLDIPVGSIGPTRARHLERLRRSPALAAFLPASAGAEGSRS
jgi:RNA polymerase sigma factor (sigma-70 family)